MGINIVFIIIKLSNKRKLLLTMILFQVSKIEILNSNTFHDTGLVDFIFFGYLL